MFDPANVSPLICWLAGPDCQATGQVFHTYGDRVEIIAPISILADFRNGKPWTVEELDKALSGSLPAMAEFGQFVPELAGG